MKGFLCGIAFLATVLCLTGCEPQVNFVGEKAQDFNVGGRILSVDTNTDLDQSTYYAVGFLHDDGSMNRMAICGDGAPPLAKGMHLVMSLHGEFGKGCYKVLKAQLIDPFEFDKPQEKKD